MLPGWKRLRKLAFPRNILLGGWTNPFEKKHRQIGWRSSPSIFGWKFQKTFELPPPSIPINHKGCTWPDSSSVGCWYPKTMETMKLLGHPKMGYKNGITPRNEGHQTWISMVPTTIIGLPKGSNSGKNVEIPKECLITPQKMTSEPLPAGYLHWFRWVAYYHPGNESISHPGKKEHQLQTWTFKGICDRFQEVIQSISS